MKTLIRQFPGDSLIWVYTVSHITYREVPKYWDTKIIKFSFVLNVKLITFKCPKIWAHFSLIPMCSNIGTLKTINFPFGTNGKLMVLDVPILKHFRINLSKFKEGSELL